VGRSVVGLGLEVAASVAVELRTEEAEEHTWGEVAHVVVVEVAAVAQEWRRASFPTAYTAGEQLSMQENRKQPTRSGRLLLCYVRLDTPKRTIQSL